MDQSMVQYMQMIPYDEIIEGEKHQFLDNLGCFEPA
jgi:hypothetical protein